MRQCNTLAFNRDVQGFVVFPSGRIQISIREAWAVVGSQASNTNFKLISSSVLRYMSILQKLHQGISMSLGAQEQSKHGNLGWSLSQLLHNIVVTLLDNLQNFLHFLFGGVLSNFLWYFWLSRMSHWFFPSSWGNWLSSWNASWSRGVFWRGNIWRENPSGSGHLTRSGDVVNVRNGSFNCKVLNGQRVLLDAMIVNFRSIIPRDSFVRGVWNWFGRSNDERCPSRHRISRGNPYGVNISIVFWEIVTPSGRLNIFNRNLVAFRNRVFHHVIILSTWLPQGIPYRWFSFTHIFDLQLRHVFTQLKIEDVS